MKIICVGRNYAEHARELNNPLPEEPVIFFKPDTALLKNNEDFYIPEFSNDIHYECELVYRVRREGKFIQEKFVWDYLNGVGLGIDFTARDIQKKCKEKGLPWTLAKGFNHAAPVSEMLSVDDFQDHGNLNFELEVNGEIRQRGNTRDMIWNIESLIAYITRYITIKKGDLIFTGTPEGVGKVNPGDRLVARLEGKELLNFHVR